MVRLETVVLQFFPSLVCVCVCVANMQTLQRPDATSHLVQPNITDKATVLTLAKISYDAYYRPNDTQHKFPVDPFVEVATFLSRKST